MKKILLAILIGGLLITTPVFAENDAAGNTATKGNSTTAGSENAALARTKRITIRTQAQELVQLRTQIKAKIAEQKAKVKQYREQEKLTTEQREEVKTMIKSMQSIQESLGTALQNASRSMAEYRKDTSANKLTGLDSVIASQQQRITLLKEALAKLSQ
jgi:chromosome segregation ATPase